jgi:hypothetical protein
LFIFSNLEVSRTGNVWGGTMKKVALLLAMALPLGLQAQQSGAGDAAPDGTVPTSVTFPVEKVQQPTDADLNCAGFIGKQLTSRDKFVTGGLETAFTTQFASGEAIFLNGKDYQLGQQYEIVRELKDPNRYEVFPGQWKSVKAAGQAFEELARVQVVDTRHKMAIARVEYSCNTVLPGDFVVPYVQKTALELHAPMRFDRFVQRSGTSGRIILAKDFDSEMGNGGKVYLNIGASQGLKVGDYLRATRSFEAIAHDSVEALSFKSPTLEPTQKIHPSLDATFLNRTNGPDIHVADMPRKGIGEIVILSVTPTTATGMVVFSLEPVHVGDRVEIDQQ